MKNIRTSYFRHIHSVNDNAFNDNLERYICDRGYNLAACTVYGNHLDKNDVNATEAFGETIYWRFGWCEKEGQETTPALRSKTIFAKGYKAIENYLKNKGNIQNPQEASAFAALKKFFLEREEHEKSLQKLKYKMSETDVASIVSQHLLSRLLPYPSNYFLDSIHTKGKSDGCPCGCGELINFGFTHVGSPNLFYGYVDVILIPSNRDLFLDTNYNKSAVFSVKKKKDEIYGHRLISRDWMNHCDFDEYEDIASGEYKTDTKYFDEKQLCKQAISVSLCKYRKFVKNGNMKKGLGDCVPTVPVCAITNEAYEVAMYHPELDFLVKSCDELKLFDGHFQHLKFSTIVDMWLLINHSLFCGQLSESTAKKLRGTADLISTLGKKRFENVVKNSHWMCLPHPRQKSFTKVPQRPLDFTDEEEDV